MLMVSTRINDMDQIALNILFYDIHVFENITTHRKIVDFGNRAVNWIIDRPTITKTIKK